MGFTGPFGLISLGGDDEDTPHAVMNALRKAEGVLLKGYNIGLSNMSQLETMSEKEFYDLYILPEMVSVQKQIAALQEKILKYYSFRK